MDLSNIIEATISFTREHEKWAPVIVFALGLVESLALLSLLVPSTIILLGIGGLFGASGLPFWPLLVSGGIGACVGYTLSYWVGRHFHEPILRNWPFSRYPAMVERSERFFERYGVFSVFLGHFFGPVRAVIPVVAGVHDGVPVPAGQYSVGFPLGVSRHCSGLFLHPVRPDETILGLS